MFSTWYSIMYVFLLVIIYRCKITFLCVYNAMCLVDRYELSQRNNCFLFHGKSAGLAGKVC
jgi:hypothetical protein